MPALAARRKAISVVSAVQTAIVEVERLNQHKPMEPRAARDAVMERIERILPTLVGLDALDAPTVTTDETLINATFDVLAQIGHDRATYSGIFADRAIRHEQAYAVALQVPQIRSAMTEGRKRQKPLKAQSTSFLHSPRASRN